MKKNITKRRRYKNRRRILRGGTIDDDDADQLLANLNGLDRRSIVDFLENIKNDTTFRNAIKERSIQFEKLKNTCKYMESLDNFVDEMIITAIKTLRDNPYNPITSEESKQELTLDNMSGLLPEGADLDALLNNLMNKYAAARIGPCLSVEGTAARFSQRALVDSNERKQKFTIRGPLPVQPRGGSRRKNKKSKRMRRRKQRGGDFLIFLGILGLGIVILVYVKYADRRKKNDEVTAFE